MKLIPKLAIELHSVYPNIYRFTLGCKHLRCVPTTESSGKESLSSLEKEQ